MDCAQYANRMLNRKFSFFLVMSGQILFVASIIVEVHSSGAVIICLTSMVLVMAIVALLNMNKNYFKFKKFACGVLWKLYNFMVRAIAVWIIDRQNKILSFDDESKTQTEGDISAVINVITWIVASTFLSLIPGFFWHKKVTVIVPIILCLYLIYRGMYYYLNQDLDAKITILNQQVSMRNQIVNRSMDLALWIGYQAYQLWTHPDSFQVTSKIEIKWSQNNL